MKKLLGIVFLGLLLFSNSNTVVRAGTTDVEVCYKHLDTGEEFCATRFYFEIV